MKFAKYLFILLVILGCNSENGPGKIKSLKLLGDVNLDSRIKMNNTHLGGLSGLFFDKNSNTLLAICDAKGKWGQPRYYKFDIKLNKKEFKLTNFRFITLKDKDKIDFAKGTVDFEGITKLKSGNLLISSEGNSKASPRVPPAIMEFTPKGQLTKLWPVDIKFIPNADGKLINGGRNNMLFESLTSTRNHNAIFYSTENALVQDDNIQLDKVETTLRIVRMRKNIKEEFAYKLGKIPNPMKMKLNEENSVNGLVDLLAIDEKHLLSLERAFVIPTRSQTIRLFNITITSGATEISKIASLKGKIITPVKKVLLLDLKDIVPKLSKGFQKLDNIEGMTIGPRLPNGNYTLILGSDNNFSQKQRTQFIAFEIN